MMRSTFLALMVLMMMVTLIVAAPIRSSEDVVDENDDFALEKRGGKTYKGTGTWFLPVSEGGNTGACGPKESNNSPIVALNAPQYGNMSKKSKWCGKKIRIKGPKGTVTATVNDACPECKHGDLDLTPVLFKKVIGNMNKGVGKISWSLA